MLGLVIVTQDTWLIASNQTFRTDHFEILNKSAGGCLTLQIYHKDRVNNNYSFCLHQYFIKQTILFG